MAILVDWQIVEMKDTEIFEVFITSQEFGDTVFNGFEIYDNEEVLNQLNQVVSLQKTKLDELDNSFEEISAEIKKIGRIELIEEGKRDGNLFYLFKEKGEAVDIKGHDLTLLIQADKSTAYVFGYVGFHGNFNQDLGHEIINSFKLK